MNVLKVSPLEHSLEGTLKASPSKYHTHRALILSALAEGESTITGMSTSLDNMSTVTCLTEMGTKFTAIENGYKVVGGPFQTPANILDCGNSGSTINFLLAVTSTAPGTIVYTGDDSLRSRPLGPYIEALNRWGIDTWSTRSNGLLPVVIRSGDITKLSDRVWVNGLISPWASGILLASPFTGHDVTVDIENGELNEASYTDLMIQMMSQFGVEVEAKEDHSSFFVKGGQKFHPAKVHIPGDIALASFGLVLAAISDSHICYTNMDPNAFHPESKILEALEQMGADVRIDPEAKTIEVYGGKPLKGIEIDCNDAPDMIPVLSILLAHGEGESRIVNAEQVHYKECDRFEAMAQLNKMGVPVEVTRDGLIIQGVKKLKGASVDSFKDHRVMMSFTIAGLVADGPTYITDPEAAGVSYPGFIKDISALGADLEIISDPA
ncbi:MAG: 3-phosphoshikimate 1-carboxyvinyltransferase [Anaerolineaceae bacterium]|nr:3-phosphoshikimate 1-carboxyvinyltransferase [Anaerolineaceae bacterium]